MKVTVYTPESALRSPRKLIGEMFSDLMQSRELAWRLAVRDINAQYRKSYLGYIWAFILPLVNTATWIFLNSSGIIKIHDTGIPYPVYVFTGTMIWQIFSEALQSPLTEISNAKPMLAKLNFPREALILSGILKTMFNSSIKIIILVPAIILMGVYPNWQIIYAFLSILSIILVGTTIGLFLSPLGTLYDDIGKSIPILTQFLMYITPVVFIMPSSGFAAYLFKLNFITPLILNCRAWFTGGSPQLLPYYLLVILSSILLFFIVWIIFRITMPILIERMSS